MADSVLKLQDVTKTYIIGQNKSAQKAQKVITKLHKKYEKACKAGDEKNVNKIEKTLEKAELEFAKEKYPQAYKTVTGKELKNSKKDKGVVVHALNGVTLDIKKGEMVAIMGPSGSGKSTLLNTLGLIDSVSSGKVYIDGIEANKLRHSKLPEMRAKKLGFVFQSYNLIPTLSALDDVMLALRYSGVTVTKRKKWPKLH